jgi:hypothetical protein
MPLTSAFFLLDFVQDLIKKERKKERKGREGKEGSK